MPKKQQSSDSYYAVRSGSTSGIFSTWEETKMHVHGIPNSIYKKFKSFDQAVMFVNGLEPLHKDREDDRLVVFTDGSSFGNGAAESIAHFAVVWPEYPYLQERHELPRGSTNNMAEYKACIRAIQQADIIDPSRKKTLCIYTDSQLLVNSMTKWIDGWKKTNWKNGTIKNLHLLQELDTLCQQRKVEWEHVHAHTNGQDWKSIWNRKADTLAQKGR